MTFTELATHYIKSPQYQGLAAQSKRMYGLYIERLMVVGGDLPIRDVELAMQKHVAPKRRLVARSPDEPIENLCGIWWNKIHAYMDESGHKATNPMKQALRTTLSVVYKWAVLKGYLSVGENFVPLIPRKPWAHEAADKHPFTVAEMDRIEHALVTGVVPGPLQGYGYFTLFAFYSGCRPDEMFDHEGKWFAKRDGTIYYEVHDAKGKATGELSRYCAMGNKELMILAWFKDQPKAMGFGHYTFRTNIGHKFTQSLVCDKFKEVCKLSNVEPRAFYNTRRGLATEMDRNGHNIQEISARLGNTVPVASRYIVKSKMEQAKFGAPIKLKA